MSLPDALQDPESPGFARTSERDEELILNLTKLAGEDPMPRARNSSLKGIIRISRGTAPDCLIAADFPCLGDDDVPGSSSTLKVLYDDQVLKPKKDFDLGMPRKVRFALPMDFREEISDRDHPRHKSLRAVAFSKRSLELQELYQGRRKRGAEFISGFSLAALSAELFRWSLLEHAAAVAVARSQIAHQWYSAGLMHLHQATAAAAEAAATGTHHHAGAHAGWMLFLKSGLMFCPVKSVQGSVLHSAANTAARQTMKTRHASASHSLHAIRLRVHQEAQTLHASHLAAIKAKTAALSAAALVHFSLCPLGVCLVGATWLYARTTSNGKSRAVQSDCSSVQSDCSQPEPEPDRNGFSYGLMHK